MKDSLFLVSYARLEREKGYRVSPSALTEREKKNFKIELGRERVFLLMTHAC